MKILSYALTLGILSLALSFDAFAARSIPNPMTPRVTNAKAFHQDYSFGYSKLAGNAIDTLEVPNRVVGWNVNYEVFDRYILRPLAHGYATLPSPVQTGVGNFLGNLNEVHNTFDNLLLGEVSSSLTSLGRFGINSTIGVLGFIDVASAMGLEAAPMDLSTVLGKAGMDQGPFLMVPGYGPTTAREVHGAVVDDVPFMAFPFYVTFAKWAINGIHARAQLVEQEGVVDNSLDPYVTTRDMYLMYSEGQVDPNAALQVDEEVLDESFLDEIDG